MLTEASRPFRTRSDSQPTSDNPQSLRALTKFRGWQQTNALVMQAFPTLINKAKVPDDRKRYVELSLPIPQIRIAEHFPADDALAACKRTSLIVVCRSFRASKP